jgi:hypothetical protein
MENQEMGQVFEGEQPNVEKLQSMVAEAEASNAKYQELMEVAK